MLLNTNDFFYVRLFNLYTYILGLKGKIYKEKNYFYINHEDLKYRFKHKKQGFMAYSGGLQNRGLNLGKEYLIDNINFKEKDIIIDCGANNGDLFLFFRNKNIKYIGIEPSPVEFNNLEENVKNCILYNKAVYKNSSLELDFFVSSEFGDSSLIKMDKYTDVIKVESITLDEIIENYQKVKLLKVEAEGAEPEILEGLSKNINKIEYITIDVGLERGVKKESTLVDCTNYLCNRNFNLIDFNPSRFVVLFKNKNHL